MAEIEVKKIGYWMPVNVVDGVPQCPCCQEPMVERAGSWMCALGAAALDLLADTTPEAAQQPLSRGLATGGVVKSAGTYVLGDGSVETYATRPNTTPEATDDGGCRVCSTGHVCHEHQAQLIAGEAWLRRDPDTTPEAKP